ALYQTGAFGAEETLVTWGVLAAYSLGLPASAGSRVLSSAFYATRDTRTPARTAYVRVGISTIAGLALMFPFDGYDFRTLRLGAVGLALGESVGAWVEYGMLRRSLGRVIGPHGPGAGPLLRFTLAAVLAAATGVALQRFAGPAHPVVVGLITIGPASLVYLGAARLLVRPSARAG